MSKSINKVTILGNLGRDPELRYTGTGTAVCNFTVATTETFKGKDGQSKEQTEWHKCVAWGKLAEICDEWLAKGSKIYVEGKLQTRDWEDKEGNKRYVTEIHLSEMIMLNDKGGLSAPEPTNNEPDID